MTLKEFWYHPDRRPLWQIALLVPVYPLYWLANEFIEFMDNNF